MSDEITLDDIARSAKEETIADADRESDVALLRDLLKDDELGAEHRADFDDMLVRLGRNSPRFPRLTQKQREYAENVADRLGVSFARRPSQRAENVTRGREVKAPDVLSPAMLKRALDARKGRA